MSLDIGTTYTCRYETRGETYQDIKFKVISKQAKKETRAGSSGDLYYLYTVYPIVGGYVDGERIRWTLNERYTKNSS